MINIAKLEKVRIHSQIGGIPELFKRSKVDIRELVRGHTHYLLFFKKQINSPESKVWDTNKGDYFYEHYPKNCFNFLCKKNHPKYRREIGDPLST